jgi:SAM-dependent methyltransferase
LEGAALKSFYDELAPFYHLLYSDWEKSVTKQGHALADLLSKCGVSAGASILDAASGIGTQTIGLIQHGYRVAASDISSGAIDRLRIELARRALSADAFIDDLRTLHQTSPESVSAIIACDNSIPHLLSDAEILQALRSCWLRLKPGGVAVFSVRDYAAMERKNPDIRPYGLRITDGNRFLAVQVWEWDADQYDLSLYLTTELPSGACDTKVLHSRYYAITIDALLELMAQAGFVDMQRRDDVLFQPVLIGYRPP